MALGSETSRVTYTANGATTAFATGFKFLSNSDLVVKDTDEDGVTVTRVLNTHYTVTGAGEDAGGTVTFLTAPTDAHEVVIERTVALTQPTAFRLQGSFSPSVHEAAIDKTMMAVQQVDRRVEDLEATVAALPDLVVETADYSQLAEAATPVSPASTARIRLYEGRLEYSVDGDRYRRISPPSVHVSDYGAVGDGVTPDDVAIQAAIDDALARGCPVAFDGDKNYAVTEKLQVLSGVLEFQGNGCTITATDVIESVLEVKEAQVRCYAIDFVGGRSADYCVYLETASGCVFEDCLFYTALVDGLHLQVDCDRVRATNCRAEVCGKVFWTTGFAGSAPAIIKTAAAGTVQVTTNQILYKTQSANFAVGEVVTGGTSGATATIVGIYDAGATGKLAVNTITGTFVADETLTGNVAGAAVVDSTALGTNTIVGTGTAFATHGVRMGDFISVHATAPGDRSASWLQMSVVDSNDFITCIRHPSIAAMAAGAKYSIHVGDGIHEGPGRADVNIARYEHTLCRNNAGAGIMVHGLYGPNIELPQCDANGSYPIVISYYNLITYGTVITGGYYEGNNAADNVFLGCAGDVLIQGARVGSSDLQPIVSSSSFNWGEVRGSLNQTNPGRIDPIGSDPVNHVPSAILAASDLGGGLRYGAYTKGILAGLNYTLGGPGLSSITMKDNLNPAFAVVSGAEPPQGGKGQTTVAYDFDTETAITNHDVDASLDGLRLLTKHHTRWRNDQVVKAALGFEGDLRQGYSDQTAANAGAGGNCTIDKPSGRFAVASGATGCTVTNALCRATSIVHLQQETTDANTKLTVTPGNGSFVVSTPATGTKVTASFTLQNTL